MGVTPCELEEEGRKVTWADGRGDTDKHKQLPPVAGDRGTNGRSCANRAV